MQYQVPQFLDIEDKIIGSLTLKQFIYLGGGVGMGYMALRFIPYIGFIFGIGLVGLGWALGFYKFNGKPFINAVEAGFYFMKSDRLYIWKRRERASEAALDLSNFKPTKHTKALTAQSKQNTSNRLSTLSWSIGLQEVTEEDNLS